MDTNVDRAKRDWGYGWVIRAIDNAFSFLVSDFGYAVMAVRTHFRGSYIAYSRDSCLITVELDDSEHDLRCHIYLPDSHDPASRKDWYAWEILEARAPDEKWFSPPDQQGLSKRDVEVVLLRWAEGLRRVAPDMLNTCDPGDRD